MPYKSPFDKKIHNREWRKRNPRHDGKERYAKAKASWDVITLRIQKDEGEQLRILAEKQKQRVADIIREAITWRLEELEMEEV